ncbi:uncharacterized protein LOC132205517 [Neocloeon triangulifer]|uniref:uncharacterized protein LOC132205517 n=1 Tax=Neocloeon triangulifer TaxID=2078957 RepID=UPI00286F4B1A|nr:uncharacterized protein LOC132205517 [Neocloeon triangulifer]
MINSASLPSFLTKVGRVGCWKNAVVECLVWKKAWNYRKNSRRCPKLRTKRGSALIRQLQLASVVAKNLSIQLMAGSCVPGSETEIKRQQMMDDIAHYLYQTTTPLKKRYNADREVTESRVPRNESRPEHQQETQQVARNDYYSTMVPLRQPVIADLEQTELAVPRCKTADIKRQQLMDDIAEYLYPTTTPLKKRYNAC